MLIAAAPAAIAQPISRSGSIARSPAADSTILSQVKAPPDFEVTVFARPPFAMYPTCLTTAPDGAVLVCVDPNLSLSTDKGRGRIMRLVDEDGDGRADRHSVFAEMDSPRGVVSDGRVVYVMHPPLLTAYRDTTGDGVADVSEDLVRGLGFDLDFRGADHATNGVTMAIDGWLYIAVGDYGYQKAVGKDGATIRHRGGSVVRVRPDGSGLEIYATGTRNIYDVAVDPFLHVFSRDNTNDGDGWDTRLHYLAAGANMGYPALYKNFADEHMPSLADYGAGAGTGGLWVHDPGFPAGFGNTLYTADWTVNKVLRHPVEARGASFAVQQVDFLSVPHPADLAMDAQSHMYVASLAGGQFTYAGDTVGYVVRLRYTGDAARPPASPVSAPASASTAQLLDVLVGANGQQRLKAQREILRRGTTAATVRRLESLTLDATRPAYARVAAMYTLQQLVGERSHATLQRAVRDPAVRALALRALADRRDQLRSVPAALFVKALADSNPAVQLQALTGLVRLGAAGAADAIVPLTGSGDAALAHVAVNALVALGARDAALKGLDGGAAAVRTGALRALQQMHDSTTVAALIERLARARELDTRRGLVGALARLYHREAPWVGEWWGTQPAFAGPYFAPVPWEESRRIAPVLRQTLLAARDEEFELTADALMRNRVLPAGAKPLVMTVNGISDLRQRTEVITALVGTSRLDSASIALLPALDARSTDLHTAVARLLAGESTVDRRTLPLVRRAVLDPLLPGELRGSLLNGVGRLPGDSGLAVAVELFAEANPQAGNPAEVEAAWRRFVGDRRRTSELDAFIALARTGPTQQRTLGYAVLLQAVRSARTPQAVRDKVGPVIDAAWKDASAAPMLVQAVTIMRLESQYAEQLKVYRKVPD
jgi:putative membrane-bound dehydrogenase-like protein